MYRDQELSSQERNENKAFLMKKQTNDFLMDELQSIHEFVEK